MSISVTFSPVLLFTRETITADYFALRTVVIVVSSLRYNTQRSLKQIIFLPSDFLDSITALFFFLIHMYIHTYMLQ